MTNLQHNFTTPEQSKRLLELGVPADSADCYIAGLFPSIRTGGQEDENFFAYNANYTPCWSVGRLIEIATECTNRESIQIKREYLKLGLIECIIALLEFAKIDGEFDLSTLEE